MIHKAEVTKDVWWYMYDCQRLTQYDTNERTLFEVRQDLSEMSLFIEVVGRKQST